MFEVGALDSLHAVFFWASLISMQDPSLNLQS